MTLPLVLHGVFPAVEATLAEPLEGEVRSVPLILRMLEASCLRLFLKFERFSLLKKCGRWRPVVVCSANLLFESSVIVRLAIVQPPFGNRPFTISDESGRRKRCCVTLRPRTPVTGGHP
jgi:hypothetical protein